jgi:imidazoleglycerol phosphate synthase glutamine amidotransferase subunit HisH
MTFASTQINIGDRVKVPSWGWQKATVVQLDPQQLLRIMTTEYAVHLYYSKLNSRVRSLLCYQLMLSVNNKHLSNAISFVIFSYQLLAKLIL